jgi:hypothetical protein
VDVWRLRRGILFTNMAASIVFVLIHQSRRDYSCSS